jgi:hypothetical protein
MTAQTGNGGQRRIAVGADGSVTSKAAPAADGSNTACRAMAESALRALMRQTLGPEGCPDVQLELADGLPVRLLLDRAVGAEATRSATVMTGQDR